VKRISTKLLKFLRKNALDVPVEMAADLAWTPSGPGPKVGDRVKWHDGTTRVCVAVGTSSATYTGTATTPKRRRKKPVSKRRT